MSTISKIALGAFASLLLGSTAMAADLMAPPPPDVAMTSDWTGGYIGVQGPVAQFHLGDYRQPSMCVLGADFQTDMFLVGWALICAGGYTQAISGGSRSATGTTAIERPRRFRRRKCVCSTARSATSLMLAA